MERGLTMVAWTGGPSGDSRWTMTAASTGCGEGLVSNGGEWRRGIMSPELLTSACVTVMPALR